MKKSRSRMAMLVLVAGSLVLGMSAPRTAAETRYVWQDSPSPGPPYTNWATAAHVIQEAVDAAQAGETVLVTNGVYTMGAVAVGDNQTNRVALTNPIVLLSVNGPAVTVIQAAAAFDGGTGDGAIRCVYVARDALLSGFTLTNGHAGNGGGVWCEASGVVSNCTLTGNSAYSGGGVVGGILYNCTLTDNSASLGGGAAGGTLYNCTLTGNTGGGASGSTLFNSIVYHNTAGEAVNHADSTFEYSCTTPLPTNGVGNIDADPQLASAAHLSATSPCIGAGSATNATGVDIDGEPWADAPCMGADQFVAGNVVGPIIVSIDAADANVVTGFASSFTGLMDGRLTHSVWDFGDGMRLTNRPFASHAWTAPGLYTVTLRGFNESFPEGISTQIQVTVLAQSVHYVNKVNPTPLFPYASWPTAATNIQDAVDAAPPGSRIWVTNGIYDTGRGLNESRVALTKPVVLRSVNGPEVTTVVGGGVGSQLRCVYVGANAILSGFTLTNGSAWPRGGGRGGGAFCESSGSVSNCVLTGNFSISFGGGRGGGVYGGSLYGCTFAGNNAANGGERPGSGGGAANATLYHCVLTGNSASVGGGASGSTLYECTVNGNSADHGGGVDSSTLFNCTLTGNSAWHGGGAYGCVLYNCIVYHNADEDGAFNHSESSFNYSCTTPLPPGEGNIDADPRFVNRAADNFRLRPDSPCIDAGTNLSVLVTTDLDGLPRSLDGNGDGVARFDMGAYEFNPYRFAPTLQFGPDGFQFTVHGEPGKSVRIERSRDLVHWEFAAEVPIPASGQTLIDPATTTEPQLFYRVISIP